MNILIIEDEVAASENIKSILYKLDSTANVLAIIDTVAESVAWLNSNPSPDLIFMDIQLADGLSFKIFECAKVASPIIFTTAYDEYAIRAFEVDSLDYLLKPISLDAVARSLDKYRRLVKTDHGVRDYISSLEKFLLSHPTSF